MRLEKQNQQAYKCENTSSVEDVFSILRKTDLKILVPRILLQQSAGSNDIPFRNG